MWGIVVAQAFLILAAKGTGAGQHQNETPWNPSRALDRKAMANNAIAVALAWEEALPALALQRASRPHLPGRRP